MVTLVKECTKCEQMLPLDKFYKYKRYGDRYKQDSYTNSRCIKCMKSIQKSHRERPEIRRSNNVTKRKWKKNNVEKVRKYDREWKREWRKNPVNKLQANISSLVSRSLKKTNVYKDSSYWECIGYTVNELKEHIEKQFTDGMTWDNYGEWHIDHIKPKSAFNVEMFGDKEFMECWGLDNLQPLWAKDNLSKSDKYEL